MEASQATEIVTEIPVMEIDLSGSALAARGESVEQRLSMCADVLQARKLALIPSAADVFQVLPVYEEEVSPESVRGLVAGRKDRVYMVSVNGQDCMNKGALI
ncbi:MAG: hypothetical protein IJP92_12705 [Lachnospiraceae bacterium]|nr:hypothetical protein [Lachnospiraceae bacterium]